MAEYKIGKAVVRVHGEIDRKRIESACLTYIQNTTHQTKTKTKEDTKHG